MNYTLTVDVEVKEVSLFQKSLHEAMPNYNFSGNFRKILLTIWMFDCFNCATSVNRSVYRVSFPVCGEKYDCCSCYNPLCYHGNLSWFSFRRLPSPCIKRPYVVPMKTLQIEKECQPQSCKTLTIILFTGASCTPKKNKLHILLGVYMWVMGVRVITSG